MASPSRRWRLLIATGPLVLVLLLRLGAMSLLFPNARHGYTSQQISSAVGIMEGRGPTSTWSEIRYVDAHRSNLTLNMDDVYFPLLRTRFDHTLPLTSYVMAAVWTLCGTRSILAYLLVILLAEVVALAPLFAILRDRFGGRTVWILALLLGLNLPLARVVVSISYDPYPYLGSLLAFSAGVFLLERRNLGGMLLAAALSAVTILGRELNLLLYPVVAGFATWRAVMSRNGDQFRRAFLFMLPFVAVVAFAVSYRYASTGNPRPTRTVFWHSLWAGVGQFPNPYGLTISDGPVIEMALKIDPTLREEVYSPRYEATLKTEARSLIREHPWLLIRNTFYRAGIILSPGLWGGGDTLPNRYRVFATIASLIGTGLVILGMIRIRRIAPSVFWMILLTLAAHIISFAWFYIVGRVMLMSSHVYLIPLSVLLSGIASRPRLNPAPG